MCHAVLVLTSLCLITASIFVVLDETFLPSEMKPYGILVLLTTGFTLIPFCDYLSARVAKTTKTRDTESEVTTEEQPLRTLTVSLI